MAANIAKNLKIGVVKFCLKFLDQDRDLDQHQSNEFVACETSHPLKKFMPPIPQVTNEEVLRRVNENRQILNSRFHSFTPVSWLYAITNNNHQHSKTIQII